ncbi:MAG TPA: hypothetical protein ENI79_00665 [Rhodospirillales bacterium]|nr:hypothetical protein [Rhodospirillales bacterium]
MPFLMIQTNQSIEPDAADALVAEASKTVAETLGKPEKYVMVALEDDTKMLFGGSPAPLAYLELKSIGLPEDRAPQLSEALSAMMERAAGTPRERVYIEFSNAPRNMWGWNGGTF